MLCTSDGCKSTYFRISIICVWYLTKQRVVVLCAKVLRYSSRSLLPPPHFHGGEWNYVHVPQSIKKLSFIEHTKTSSLSGVICIQPEGGGTKSFRLFYFILFYFFTVMIGVTASRVISAVIGFFSLPDFYKSKIKRNPVVSHLSGWGTTFCNG